MFFQGKDNKRTTIIDSQFTWENTPCEQKNYLNIQSEQMQITGRQ